MQTAVARQSRSATRIGHNLLPLDVQAIVKALSEAEQATLARARALVEAGTRLPSSLPDQSALRRARHFAHLLQDAGAELRRARLAGTQPLRAAMREVETVFAPLEKEVKAVRGRALDMLDTALAEGRLALATPLAPRPTPAGGTLDPLIESVAPDARAETPARVPEADRPPPDNRPEVTAGWVVVGIDRAALDLEALRPYLTDHALRAAAERHLRAEGPHRLAGARHALRSQG